MNRQARVYMRFVPVSMELPSEPGIYTCITKSGEFITVNYNTKHKMFNVSDDDTSTAITPLAWAKPSETLKRFVKELCDEQSTNHG